jgi:hypothetical protein
MILKILKARNTAKGPLAGIQAIVTMARSNTFQPDLKYEVR